MVAGGGFAGVEAIGGINDFVRDAIRFYPALSEADVRMVLVTPDELILPELAPKLGAYAQRKLVSRGIEILTQARVAGYQNGSVLIRDGKSVPACTLVWTAGNTGNPLVASLPLPIAAAACWSTTIWRWKTLQGSGRWETAPWYPIH